MKILTIVGARPQFIKASPVSRALADAGLEEVIIHTGQHYDPGMSQVFFDQLGIPAPLVNLEVGSGSHAEQTAAMLVGIDRCAREHNPDWILVYGDTNSTLAGALVAAKAHIPVAHVEAGLRSFNRLMPEEINRIVADSVSDLLFVPTAEAARNLQHEGVPDDRVHMVGDVMYDAALLHGSRADSRSSILADLKLDKEQFILATIHRAENTDDPARIDVIVKGLVEVAEKIRVVIPVHPRTRAALRLNGLLEVAQERLMLIDPVGYLDMVNLERSAALIATDSGGVQKEAFFNRVPCVTLRNETEWVELVELGWNRLCPPASAEIVARTVLSAIGTAGREASPYGNGDASKRIADVLFDISEGGADSRKPRSETV